MNSNRPKAETMVRSARDELLEAAREYADATPGDGSVPGDNPHAKAVRLKLAAKAFRAAEARAYASPS